MNILFGIKNCDTVKKARRWLDEHGVEYRFHDLRVDGIHADELHQWCAQAGWENLLNRRGTTWRGLPDINRLDMDAQKAESLMVTHPTLIKRPILAHEGGIEVGFTPERYNQIFG